MANLSELLIPFIRFAGPWLWWWIALWAKITAFWAKRNARVQRRTGRAHRRVDDDALRKYYDSPEPTEVFRGRVANSLLWHAARMHHFPARCQSFPHCEILLVPERTLRDTVRRDRTRLCIHSGRYLAYDPALEAGATGFRGAVDEGPADIGQAALKAGLYTATRQTGGRLGAWETPFTATFLWATMENRG